MEIVERRAGDMNSQEISMTLNAVSKLESAAHAMVREEHQGGRGRGEGGGTYILQRSRDMINRNSIYWRNSGIPHFLSFPFFHDCVQLRTV